MKDALDFIGDIAEIFRGVGVALFIQGICDILAELFHGFSERIYSRCHGWGWKVASTAVVRIRDQAPVALTNKAFLVPMVLLPRAI